MHENSLGRWASGGKAGRKSVPRWNTVVKVAGPSWGCKLEAPFVESQPLVGNEP